jgi:hypothetical protein
MVNVEQEIRLAAAPDTRYHLDHTVFFLADKHIKVFFSFYHNAPH